MYENAITHEFLFDGRKAIVIEPKVPANGRWLWKAEYFDAFPNFEEAMVEKGYHVCYIENDNRWATPEVVERAAAFLQYVSETYHLEKRGVPVGMSCGGLLSAQLAIAHPELVAVLYLDAPVLNILSLAGLGECEVLPGIWLEILNTYEFNKSSLISFRNSPIDHMDKLLENKIPILLLYGNADKVVMYAENGKVLYDYYTKNGGTIKAVCKSMMGHHPHGLEDPQPIIDFVEEHFYDIER